MKDKIKFLNIEMPRSNPLPILDALEMVIGLLAIVGVFWVIGLAVLCF
jgi:hypothetical protein